MTGCVHIWYFSTPVRGASHTPNAEDWFALITAQTRTPDSEVMRSPTWKLRLHTLNGPSACGKLMGGQGRAVSGATATGAGVDNAGTPAPPTTKSVQEMNLSVFSPH